MGRQVKHRGIRNPIFGLVEWKKGQRKIKVRILKSGILKYLDVHLEYLYHDTFLLKPLYVGAGDELILNMPEIKKYDSEECFVIQMHLPPVTNGPLYGNVNRNTSRKIRGTK